MSTPLHELETEVLALSAEHSARPLEELIKSFETESATQKAWVVEALRRQADVQTGRAVMVPGDEALARAWARIA